MQLYRNIVASSLNVYTSLAVRRNWYHITGRQHF